MYSVPSKKQKTALNVTTFFRLQCSRAGRPFFREESFKGIMIRRFEDLMVKNIITFLPSYFLTILPYLKSRTHSPVINKR